MAGIEPALATGSKPASCRASRHPQRVRVIGRTRTYTPSARLRLRRLGISSRRPKRCSAVPSDPSSASAIPPRSLPVSQAGGATGGGRAGWTACISTTSSATLRQDSQGSNLQPRVLETRTLPVELESCGAVGVWPLPTALRPWPGYDGGFRLTVAGTVGALTSCQRLGAVWCHAQEPQDSQGSNLQPRVLETRTLPVELESYAGPFSTSPTGEEGGSVGKTTGCFDHPFLASPRANSEGLPVNPAGLEPATRRLRVGCSPVELRIRTLRISVLIRTPFPRPDRESR